MPELLTATQQPATAPAVAAAAEAAPAAGLSMNLYFPLWAALLVAAAVIILIGLLLLFVLNKQKRTLAAMAATAARKVDLVTIGKLHEQGARAGQQDCFGVSDESVMASHGLLAVVADGMGGLSDGDKISAAAVEAVLDGFTEAKDEWPAERLLAELVRRAARTVNGLLGPADYRKSGTTLVMGLVKDGNFSFLSVGDSRVCLYRRGALMLLNREHIYRNDLLLRAVNGEMAVQEALQDQKAASLTSFLGMGMLTHVDLPAAPIRLQPGDRLILMSDGVYNALSERELTEALDLNPEEAAAALKEAIEAKSYTNQDNFTAVILACGTQDAARGA